MQRLNVVVSIILIQYGKPSPTFICVLSCELSNRITDLGPDRIVGLVG
jgi:hypothetical protein